MKQNGKCNKPCQNNELISSEDNVETTLGPFCDKMFARQSKLHDLSKLNLTLICSHFRHKRLKHKQAQLRLYYPAQ